MTRNDNTNTKKLSKVEAGRLGGLARLKKHGNPGTALGRKKGGLRSLETHKKLKTQFRLQKIFRKPKPSAKFAEFTGIMLGDGHIGKYQSSITTNSETDREHAEYVSKLVTQLFHIEAPIQKKKNSNAVTIVLSSYGLCRFLEKQCFVQGNKVINNVPIPHWIISNPQYAKSCIRGLFDTDGCVYLDKHTIQGVEYKNIGLSFVNHNTNMLFFFKETLSSLGLHPTQKTKSAVFLRRKNDIDIFFKKIGSSNSKHLERYRSFRSTTGRVA